MWKLLLIKQRHHRDDDRPTNYPHIPQQTLIRMTLRPFAHSSLQYQIIYPKQSHRRHTITSSNKFIQIKLHFKYTRHHRRHRPKDLTRDHTKTIKVTIIHSLTPTSKHSGSCFFLVWKFKAQTITFQSHQIYKCTSCHTYTRLLRISKTPNNITSSLIFPP